MGVTCNSNTVVTVVKLSPPVVQSHFVMQKYAFSMDGVKSTIIPRIVELSKTYSVLFNTTETIGDGLDDVNDINRRTTEFGDHLKNLFDFFDTSYAINLAEANNDSFQWKESHFSRDLSLFHELGDSITNVISYYKCYFILQGPIQLRPFQY